MTKSIENIVSFPVNAQRNSFFGALSSILLYRNAYTEDTPFFCGKYQRNCIRCGGCGNEPFINNELTDKSSARAELRSFFQELFTIDRQVSHLLQECLSLL